MNRRAKLHKLAGISKENLLAAFNKTYQEAGDLENITQAIYENYLELSGLSPDSYSLDSFKEDVIKLAAKKAHKYGRKAWIASVYANYVALLANMSDYSLNDFKSDLLKLSKDGKVQLARFDMPAAALAPKFMDLKTAQKLVNLSQIDNDGLSTFHFIVLE